MKVRPEENKKATVVFGLNMTYKVKYFKGLTIDTKGLSEHDTFSLLQNKEKAKHEIEK